MSHITNASRAAVMTGSHQLGGSNCILIQITDPAQEPPIPAKHYCQKFHFEFLDADVETDEIPEEALFSYEQAMKIRTILLSALEHDLDVVVHCNAGICRSGAITDVGTLIGMREVPNVRRQPNLRVKKILSTVLGVSNDYDNI